MLRVMRLPLTKYGLPQVAIYPSIILAAMVIYGIVFQHVTQRPVIGYAAFWIPIILLLAVLGWMLAFFRDPKRRIPDEADLLLSPADGTVTAVETLEACEGFEGPVLCIKIFLNIFNVHINRVPCAVRIGTIDYRPGSFIDARKPESSVVNESNAIEMFRLDAPTDRLLVRQISGAVARRIVCEARSEAEYPAGAQFGMIKFGSGTELYVPLRQRLECLVHKGDKVKAGLTVLARYHHAAQQ